MAAPDDTPSTAPSATPVGAQDISIPTKIDSIIPDAQAKSFVQSPKVKLQGISEAYTKLEKLAADPLNGLGDSVDAVRKSLGDKDPLSGFSESSIKSFTSAKGAMSSIPGMDGIDLSSVEKFGDCFKNIDELLVDKAMEIGMALLNKANLLAGIAPEMTKALSAAVELAQKAMAFYEKALAMYEAIKNFDINDYAAQLMGGAASYLQQTEAAQKIAESVNAAAGAAESVNGIIGKLSALNPCTMLDKLGNPVSPPDPTTLDFGAPAGIPAPTIQPDNPFELPPESPLPNVPAATTSAGETMRLVTMDIRRQIGEITNNNDNLDIAEQQTIVLIQLRHQVSRKLLLDAQRGTYNSNIAKAYVAKCGQAAEYSLGPDLTKRYNDDMAGVIQLLDSNAAAVHEQAKLTTPYANNAPVAAVGTPASSPGSFDLGSMVQTPKPTAPDDFSLGALTPNGGLSF